jgi:polyphosphate glucokinase
VDEVVLGGGNVKHLKALPAGCRLGSNAHAFLGGFRLFEPARARRRRAAHVVPLMRARAVA